MSACVRVRANKVEDTSKKRYVQLFSYNVTLLDMKCKWNAVQRFMT